MNYQAQLDIRFFAKICFWISLLLLIVAIPSALALNAPNSVVEGEVLTVTFNDTNGELHRDGSIVATTSPYEWQTTNADAGLYEFTAYQNGTPQATKTVEVIDKPLSFTIQEPAEADYAQNTIPIQLETESTVDFCYYVLGAESNTLDETGNTHTGEFIRPDGIYTVELKCKLGAEVATQERTLLIDTTAPEVLSFSPIQGANIETETVTLSVTTNEVATCTARLATETVGSEMQSGDFLTHTLIVDTREGTQNYLVTCKDTHGNENTPTQLTFTTSIAPTAEIDVESGESTLAAGSYKITVTPSEELIQAPTLTFEYQTSGSGTVVLTQNGDEWEGFLAIPSSTGEKVGSFSIRMQDLQGTIGTTITKGALFLVDTEEPDKITSVAVEQEGQDIEISWLDDQDDVTYTLYRSTRNTVTTDDFLAEVSTTTYLDTSTEPNTPYYYSVRAVDEAGNEGLLSTPEGILRETTSVPATNEGQLYDAQQMTARVEKTIFDLEAAYDALETEKDEQKLLFIRELGLLQQLLQAKATLTPLVNELQTLPGTEQEFFQERLTTINSAVTNAMNLIPSRIEIEGRINYEQPSDIAVQNLLFDTATPLLGVMNEEEYRSSIEELMNNADLSAEITTAKIVYTDRREEHFLFFEQEVALPPQPGESSLFVYIADEFVNEVTKLQFEPAPDVQQEGIIQFRIPPMQTRFSYAFLLEEQQDLATARTIRSVLFPQPSANSAVTGYAIAGPSEYWDFFTTNTTYMLAGIIILVLLGYYFFMDSPARGDDFFASLVNKLDDINTVVSAQQTPVQMLYARPQSFYQRPAFFKRRRIKRPHFKEIPRPQPIPRDVSAILQRAHEAIDNKQYIDARELYRQGFALLSDEHKETANELYRKIALYREMQAAVAAANEENLDILKAKLESVASIAALVPESDSALIMSAKETYKSLRQVTNKLSIDQDTL